MRSTSSKSDAASLRRVHPAVKDAYGKGFADGINETLSQLRMRFNLDLIEGLQDFVSDVQEKVDEAAA